jgi:SNF family Na+-dependent transporter
MDMCFFLAIVLASLSSKIQIEIAKSALEAEFKVVAEAIKEAV